MNKAYSNSVDSGDGFNPIPSLFTLCNALCGFTSILYTMATCSSGERIPAISLLLVGGAMIFDVLDGLAARVLKAQSTHGMNLDSMADVISFGVAPAVMIYRIGLGNAPVFDPMHNFSWLAAAFYLGCALWRLASFNTLTTEEKGDHGDFIGLPSPGAAALICSIIFVVPVFGLGQTASLILYMAYAVFSAILMVSAVPYTHIRRALSGNRKWVTIPFLVGFMASFIIFKIWALVIWAHLYVLYAPLWALETRLMQHLYQTRAAGIAPDDED